MARGKMVYVTKEVHQQLKLLAAQRNRPMGKLVEELVANELGDAANAWMSPEGLMLQQKVLALLWEDPDLDVYDDD